MGLDATVMCNCLREGRAKSPPFPLDWFEIDAEGQLNITKPYDSNDNLNTLFEWMQTCCEHEGMDYACEHISNWGGYRLFQAALEEIGWHHFPTLHEQLPNANGGLTPAAASAQALKELDFFGSRGAVGTNTVLVDTASGDALYERVAAYDGIFIFDGRHGIRVGLSEFELFAIDAEKGDDLFRATRIKQFNKDGSKVSGDSNNVVWEDLDTGTQFDAGIPVSGRQIPWEDGKWQKPDGRCRFDYPSEFHIEQRARHVEEFDHIVAALKTVFTASVETGNPVRWC